MTSPVIATEKTDNVLCPFETTMKKICFIGFGRIHRVIDNKLDLYATVKPVIHGYLFHCSETRQELVTTDRGIG